MYSAPAARFALSVAVMMRNAEQIPGFYHRQAVGSCEQRVVGFHAANLDCQPRYKKRRRGD